MNDERFLKDWLDDDAPDPAGARRDADQIMARLPETKQRSRWWPLLPARRSRPRSSSGGQPPSVKGRTRTMFSPVKAVTAGLVVFVLGGALLIAQPFDQQSARPGAEVESVAPTWVTGTIEYASCDDAASDVAIDVIQYRGYECSPLTWTASDPRLTGTVTRRWNADVYRTDEGGISVNTSASYLSNGGGGWVCSSSSLAKGADMFAVGVTGETATCVGEDGYEGYSALLVMDGPAGPKSIEGIIFSGAIPPPPGPPAAE